MNFHDRANQMTKKGNFGHIIDNLAHSLPFVGSYLNYQDMNSVKHWLRKLKKDNRMN